MANILMALEIGANLGHAVRMTNVGRALRRAGHKVVFAMPDGGDGSALVDHHAFRRVAMPLPAEKVALADGAASHAEILLVHGFVSTSSIRPALAGWRRIIEAEKIDHIVADFAPSAVCAARDVGIPVTYVGTGFSLPLHGEVCRSFREFPGSVERAVKAERHVVKVIRSAVGSELAARIDNCADLYPKADCLLASWPELDWLGPRAMANYVKPSFGENAGARGTWKGRSGRRALAYFRPSMAGFGSILEALVASDAEVILAAPGIGADAAQSLSSSRIQVHNGPVDVSRLIRDADVFLHHGGLGSLSLAVSAGVPSLCVPQFDEQFLNIACAAKLGVAQSFSRSSVSNLGQAVQKTLANTGLIRRAQSLSVHVAGHRLPELEDEIVHRIRL